MFNCGTDVDCLNREARKASKRIVDELYTIQRKNRRIADVWTLISIHTNVSMSRIKDFMQEGSSTIDGLEILNHRHFIYKKNLEEIVYRILLDMARFFLRRKTERVIFILNLFAFVMTIAGVFLIFEYAI